MFQSKQELDKFADLTLLTAHNEREVYCFVVVDHFKVHVRGVLPMLFFVIYVCVENTV